MQEAPNFHGIRRFGPAPFLSERHEIGHSLVDAPLQNHQPQDDDMSIVMHPLHVRATNNEWSNFFWNCVTIFYFNPHPRLIQEAKIFKFQFKILN